MTCENTYFYFYINMSSQEEIQNEIQNEVSQKKISSSRKRRITKSEVFDFVKWAYTYDENIYEKFTTGRIRQIYHDETGCDISDVCIRNQRNRWKIVDGEVVRNNS